MSRRKQRRRRRFPLLLLLLLIAAALLYRFISGGEKPPVDPHEGQVYINDGFGMVWYTPLEGVDVSGMKAEEFCGTGLDLHYMGDAYETRLGVDVSAFQGEIDWKAVKASGVDFAYIQIGYRGYTEGGLFTDSRYAENIVNAHDNGLDVGVYFFSQAVNVAEALEEAEFAIGLVDRFRYMIDLPFYYDWEKIETDGYARTDGMDYSVLNDCAVAFCESLKSAGFTPGVYFNRYIGYYGYDLSHVNDYCFWLSVPGNFPDFYYESDIWQYTFSAAVPGIEGETDMNMMFAKIEPPAAEEETGTQ